MLGDGVLGNVCSQQRQRCQFSQGYLGSVNPFDRTARNGRGHCFCLWFSFRPLTSPFSTLDQFLLGILLSPSIRRGKGGDCEESIMELFKFVSNIEISFMPGKLIIEVYRRTRRRLRMPGIVREEREVRGGELFVFHSTIVSYCPSPSGFLLPLFRACSFLREGTRTFLPRRVDGFCSILRTREALSPMKMARKSEENCRLKRSWRFIKSYRLIRTCRVPKPNKSISQIDMRDYRIFVNQKEWIYLFLRKRPSCKNLSDKLFLSLSLSQT